MKQKVKSPQSWKPIDTIPSLKKECAMPIDGSWFMITKLDYLGHYMLPPVALRWIPYHDEVPHIGRFICTRGFTYQKTEDFNGYSHWSYLP